MIILGIEIRTGLPKLIEIGWFTTEIWR